MKKRSMLFMVAFIFFLCGCTIKEDKNRIQTVIIQEADLPERPMQEDSSKEIEEMVQETLAARLQESLEGAMVQIVTEKYGGSGVIYYMDEETVRIVTAGHIMEDWPGQTFLIFADGLTLPCMECVRDSDSDVAFLEVAVSDIPVERKEEFFECCNAISCDLKAFDALKVDDCVVAIGSVRSVAENAYEGVVKDTWIYSESFREYMLTAYVYVQEGMSGGALVDRNGNFLGVICGVTQEEGKDVAAILPLNIIQAREALLLTGK